MFLSKLCKKMALPVAFSLISLNILSASALEEPTSASRQARNIPLIQYSSAGNATPVNAKRYNSKQAIYYYLPDNYRVDSNERMDHIIAPDRESSLYILTEPSVHYNNYAEMHERCLKALRDLEISPVGSMGSYMPLNERYSFYSITSADRTYQYKSYIANTLIDGHDVVIVIKTPVDKPYLADNLNEIAGSINSDSHFDDLVNIKTSEEPKTEDFVLEKVATITLPENTFNLNNGIQKYSWSYLKDDIKSALPANKKPFVRLEEINRKKNSLNDTSGMSKEVISQINHLITRLGFEKAAANFVFSPSNPVAATTVAHKESDATMNVTVAMKPTSFLIIYSYYPDSDSKAYSEEEKAALENDIDIMFPYTY